ncbi:hypothetical protein BV898_03316 [Hypsibius exemplaris]|uniref:Protein sleepless n=1 Tax=Hypsibius exemplaris TaxID=2072580 RepID=A0A1W0X5V8_HYPEX|nr:hypothetical protein BV898_03316 [Hypsibius exemplaris]
MNKIASTLSILVLLLSFLADAFAIRCYSCESDHDGPCSDEFIFNNQSIAVVECGTGNCVKSKGNRDDPESVRRMCNAQNSPDSVGCTDFDGQDVLTSTCVCNTDLCNQASTWGSFASALSIGNLMLISFHSILML